MNDQTKNCHEIALLLDAYHDKELSLAENELVESHLVNCPPCQESLKQIATLVHSLKSLPLIEASDDLSEKLDRLLLPKPIAQPTVIPLAPKVISFNRYKIALAASAACAAIIFLTIHFAPKANMQIATTGQQHNPGNKPNSASHTKTANTLTAVQIAQSATMETKVSLNKTDTEENKHALKDKEKPAPSIKAESTVAAKAISHDKPVAVATNTSSNSIPLNKLNPIAVKPQSPSSDDGPTAEIATAYDGEPRGTAEAIGIATDEDGLYALKL